MNEFFSIAGRRHSTQKPGNGVFWEKLNMASATFQFSFLDFHFEHVKSFENGFGQ